MTDGAGSARQDGGASPDDEQAGQIAAYIAVTHRVPAHLIKREHYILSYDWRFVGVFSRLDPHVTDGMARINRPDIIVMSADDPPRPRLIIEIDGMTHHRKEHDRDRTPRRNEHYERLGVPFCIIDIPAFKREGTDWFKFLDRRLREPW